MMILLSFYAEAQEPATIILGIAPETNGTSELVTELQGEVTFTSWDKDYVHIEMKIKATDASLEVAKYLISRERFCIKTKYLDDGSQVFSCQISNFRYTSMANCFLKISVTRFSHQSIFLYV